MTMTVNRTAQQGYMLLAILLILVIGGSSVVLAGLGNRQSTWLKQQEEVRRQLVEAKAALLAYAANSAALNAGARGPGFFPCPDTDNDGDPETACNSNSALLGRLPEFQDFSGTLFRFNDKYADVDQQFWYAVGPRYVYDTATTTNRRSRLRTSSSYAASFWLRLDGTSEYVALIIAPGEALDGQDRASGPTSYGNYLDGSNGDDGFNFYTSDSSNPSLFNDQVIGITWDEYMVAVGATVAREVKTVIDFYALTNSSTYPPDSGSLNSTSCSSTSGTTFSNRFDSSAVWLRDASASTNGNNNERWSCPSGMFWNRTSSSSASGVGELKFNGCSNLTFTLTYGGGIVRTGNGC